MSLALIVDIGSTNIKVGVINPEGEVLGLEAVANEPSRPERGAYEHDPKGMLATIAKLTRKLAETYGGEIAFIGLSGYQFGFLPLDRNGEPLTGMMTLLDNRPKVVMDGIQATYDVEDLYIRTGCPPLFTYAFSKLHWLKKHKPKIFANAVRYADLKSFLLEQWTGHFVTEPSIAAATQLLNVHTSDWDDEVLSWAGIDRSYLPKIVPGDSFAGTLTEKTAESLGLKPEVQVLPGLYDGGAMILGMGGYGENIAVCNLGTTAMLRGCATEPLLDDPKLMRQQTYPLLPGYWVTGGALNNAGVALRWYRDTFEPDVSFEAVMDQAEKVKTGSEGLFCLPFLTGERDPRIGDQASAMFFGLKEFHNKGHMSRAILEGVAYALNMVKTAASENRFDPKLLRVGGSGAKSDLWTQILADVLHIKVQRMSTPEAALIGVAILGFKALGEFSSIEAASEKMIRTGETFEPSEKDVEYYARGYSFYTHLIETLKESYTAHGNL